MEYRSLRLGCIGTDPVIGFSVDELVRYLKQMDPDLKIDILQTERPEPEFERIIWVGCHEELKQMLLPVGDAALDDAITISVKDSAGTITGTNPRSVLIAAYRFLRELGCAWVRPGVEGERIPRKEICGINVEVREKARYRHRGVCIEGANTYENIRDMIDYLPKVAMNEYFIQFMVPGTFFNHWYDHEGNPYLKGKRLSRPEIMAFTKSLEGEISRRGLCYHKVGHGWTCEPFGLDGSGWDTVEENALSEEVRSYLALTNGKRELWKGAPINTNLCYSNPVVRDKVTNEIVSYCRNNPHVSVLHFWLADDFNNQCECEECVKKRPADWYVQMLNELDEKLTDAGVPTKIVFLIYVDLLWEPLENVIKNTDRFILMFAPITRKYDSCYGDCTEYKEELPPYIRNKLEMPSSLAQNIEHLRRWQKNFYGDSFSFDYHLMWIYMNDPGCERFAKGLHDDMRTLKDIGLNGMVSCQVQRVFFPTALPFNIMAATLWNRECDFEAEATAFYRDAYGKDGDLVHGYMAKLSSLFSEYDGKTAPEGYYCKDYADVRKAVADFIPIIDRNQGEEWEILRLHCEYVRIYADGQEAYKQGNLDRSEAAVQQIIDFMCRNELKLQKVLDVNNCVRRLPARMHR